MTGEDPEDELAARQDPRLYPVGAALRSMFDADNHDSLDPATTGLMLDLARVERDDAQARPGPPPAEPGLLGRLLGMLPGRRRRS